MNNQLTSFVSIFFDPEPIQWGLRGDPILWRDMKEQTSLTPTPDTEGELEQLLYALFEELTGEPAQKRTSFYVKKYALPTGLSKGMINADFWIDTAFPLIIKRYTDSKKTDR